MTFSIIIPAFNEYETLEQNIWTLSKRFPTAEILVIENGTNIAPDFSYLQNCKTLLCRTKGLGIALKYGMLSAHNRSVIFLPADLSYDLKFAEHADYLIDKGFDLVIGSKAISDPKDIQRPFLRKAVSYGYNLAYNVLFNLRIGDITGVKGYNMHTVAPLLHRCSSDGIYFEVQLLRELRKEHMKIIEIPVRVRDMRKGAYAPF